MFYHVNFQIIAIIVTAVMMSMTIASVSSGGSVSIKHPFNQFELESDERYLTLTESELTIFHRPE